MRPMRVTITAVQGHGPYHWRLSQKLEYAIDRGKSTHVQTSLLPLLFELEQVAGRLGPHYAWAV